MQRPNVLLIITDQHRADHLGCYGNGTVRTPNIDGLARRGWTADRFYVASAICMPNRATLMTGRMPSVHGVRHNGISLSLDETTFPEVLRAGGYRTALIGKSHLQHMTDDPPVEPGPDQRRSDRMPPYALREARHRDPDTSKYDQESPLRWRDPAHEMQLPFYGFDDVELCIGHGDLVDGAYGRWLRARLPDADRLRGRDGAARSPEIVAPQAWRTRIPSELYPTSYVEQKTIEWLSSHVAGADRRPFFVQCSFPDPHHPFTPPGTYWEMYDPADIALPESFRAVDAHSPPHLRALHEERDSGKAFKNGQAVFACNERETREATALTYGMIAMIDDSVGRILAHLKQLGIAGDTIVIFTSDHGDFMGDHQLMLKGPLHYDGVIRTPFIWYDPRQPAYGRRSSTLTSTIDIAPTVLESADCEPFNGIQGRSLLRVIRGEEAQPRETLLIEEESQRVQMGFQHRTRVRTLLSDRYRLSVYDGVRWGELYDRFDDPNELVNRWSDPASSHVREELGIALVQAMIGVSETSPHPKTIA